MTFAKNSRRLVRVRCRSGLQGWRCRLRRHYRDFNEFAHYAATYGLAKRLGYRTATGAWKANPVVEGSVVPDDMRRVGK